MRSSGRIVVCGSLAAPGIELLEEAGFEVLRFADLDEEAMEAAAEAVAVTVRSKTRITAEVLDRLPGLKVVGRPGAGIDNVDVEAATARGVVVMNTPGGNAVSVAEHTIALMLALTRDLGTASRGMREGRWLKKAYEGRELAGKTLGLVGLGQIGSEVARRGRALGMQVIAHDPFISETRAGEVGAALAGLDEVLAQADILSLHAPATPENQGLLDADRLARMKEGALLVNTSRGTLVDQTALVEALGSGRLAGAALDVFESEPPPEDDPLAAHPKVFATPHIAGSSVEGQVRVGTALARQLIGFLEEGVITNAVNFPSLPESVSARLQPALEAARRLGLFLAQLSGLRIEEVGLRYYGEWSEIDTAPLTAYALAGVLAPASGDVTPVNARSRAADRGIEVVETRSSRGRPYTGLVSLQLRGEGRTEWAEATVSGGRPRVTGLGGIDVEADLAGCLLAVRNDDVPGVLGRVASTLGEAGVNIASVALGRRSPGAQEEPDRTDPDRLSPGDEEGAAAMALFQLDERASEDTLTLLRALAGVHVVRQVELPPMSPPQGA